MGSVPFDVIEHIFTFLSVPEMLIGRPDAVCSMWSHCVPECVIDVLKCKNMFFDMMRSNTRGYLTKLRCKQTDAQRKKLNQGGNELEKADFSVELHDVDARPNTDRPRHRELCVVQGSHDPTLPASKFENGSMRILTKGANKKVKQMMVTGGPTPMAIDVQEATKVVDLLVQRLGEATTAGFSAIGFPLRQYIPLRDIASAKSIVELLRAPPIHILPNEEDTIPIRHYRRYSMMIDILLAREDLEIGIAVLCCSSHAGYGSGADIERSSVLFSTIDADLLVHSPVSSYTNDTTPQFAKYKRKRQVIVEENSDPLKFGGFHKSLGYTLLSVLTIKQRKQS